MASAGMDIARFNTKYGDEAEFDKISTTLKKLNVDILYDIKKKNS